MGDIVGLIEEFERQGIAVHRERCVAVRNRNATCRRCVEACPARCITCEDNELIVDAGSCLGCGACAVACPVDAFEMKKPSDEEIAAACMQALAASGNEVVIVCEQMLAAAGERCDRSKAASVPCLARVDESLIATLVAAGADRVMLVAGRCSECDAGTVRPAFESVTASAKNLIGVWNSSASVELSDRLPSSVRARTSSNHSESRRGFFSEMQKEARTAAMVVAEHTVCEHLGSAPADEANRPIGKRGVLPRSVPPTRKRLIEALSRLGEPDDVMLETRLWGHVIIDPEKCSSCQMCATFCPTGGLRKFKTPRGRFGVVFHPRLCVGCGCCTDICPTQALELSKESFAADMLPDTLERFEMRPPKNPPNQPLSIVNSVRSLIGNDQVYER